jgi:hypothetical protein
MIKAKLTNAKHEVIRLRGIVGNANTRLSLRLLQSSLEYDDAKMKMSSERCRGLSDRAIWRVQNE